MDLLDEETHRPRDRETLNPVGEGARRVRPVAGQLRPEQGRGWHRGDELGQEAPRFAPVVDLGGRPCRRDAIDDALAHVLRVVVGSDAEADPQHASEKAEGRARRAARRLEDERRGGALLYLGAQLPQEVALAEADLAGQLHESKLLLFRHEVVGAHEHRELAAAREEWLPGRAAQAPGAQGLVRALARDAVKRHELPRPLLRRGLAHGIEIEGGVNQALGAAGQDRPPRRGGSAGTVRQVYRGTHDVRGRAAPCAHGADHDDARAETDAKGKIPGVTPGQLLRARVHRDRGAHGTKGVVLAAHGHAEHGDHSIARVLHDGAVLPLHLPRQRPPELVGDLAQRVRLELDRQVTEAHELREENGDELALLDPAGERRRAY